MLTSCSTDNNFFVETNGNGEIAVKEDGPTLDLFIRLEDAMTVTRSDEGKVTATSREKEIKNLQIWVFKTDNAQLLGHLTPTITTNLLLGETVKYQMVVPETYINSGDKRVDVFVLINAESIGQGTLNAQSSRADLQAALITGDYFGVQNPCDDEFVRSNNYQGLPYTGMYLSAPIVSTLSSVYSVKNIVRVRRAVSRIRFVFCQPELTEESAVNPFTITGVQLNGNLIADKEYVFCPQTYDEGDNYSEPVTYMVPDEYESDAIVYDVSTLGVLAKVENPEVYVYNTTDFPTPQAYENTINSAINEGKLTEFGLTYLRESDKQLTVTLNYRAYDNNKTATVTMETAGDFGRNHSWIVYAYFLGGELCLHPTLMPWNAAHDRLQYNTEGSTEMEWEGYLHYDDAELSPGATQLGGWENAYTAIAYGYAGMARSSKPTRSPQIKLITNHLFPLRLQVDNERFEIILENEQNMTYSSVGPRLDIENGNQTIVFYVVPIDNSGTGDAVCHAVLTVLRTDMPSYNIPFNHDLPGYEDHSCITYYNVGSASYSDAIEANKEWGDPGKFWWRTKTNN